MREPLRRRQPPPDPNAIPNSQFFEVAGRGSKLPLQPWAAELKKKRMADNSKDNPDVWCLPIGLMQYHNHPQPRQIVQTKNLMLITYEANYGLRYIYTDGRPAPNNDPQPWWFGYSRGWWEGDERSSSRRRNFRGDERAGWLDVNGSPYTDALKMTERFRRPDFGTLQIDVTIDDPEGVHEAVHGAREPPPHGGYGDDRVHLQRERALDRAHRAAEAASEVERRLQTPPRPP